MAIPIDAVNVGDTFTAQNLEIDAVLIGRASVMKYVRFVTPSLIIEYLISI